MQRRDYSDARKGRPDFAMVQRWEGAVRLHPTRGQVNQRIAPFSRAVSFSIEVRYEPRNRHGWLSVHSACLQDDSSKSSSVGSRALDKGMLSCRDRHAVDTAQDVAATPKRLVPSLKN